IFGQNVFLNDLLTPAVRLSPWVMLLLGPMGPMVSSDDCRDLTGIPVTQTSSQPLRQKTVTSSDQSRLVLLISNFLLLNISTREEKTHHPFKELIHELDC
uniref:Uncharacterized protein n=1 Tax=Neogobius melanostomus TaxID=47308 RepID=A0A8C6TGD0_9GOBI